MPPTSDKLINMLEMVQHKAVKFVANIYPKKDHYEEFSILRLLQNLNWETLETRRKQLKVSLVYKILRNHLIITPDYLPYARMNRPKRKCTEPKVGFHNQLLEPESRLNATSKTFFYSAPKLWNENVSPSQAAAPSIEAFKRHFHAKH